jgi:hypothetical protein
MQAKFHSRPDLLLLLSLLLVILLNPMMDHSGWRRLALAALTFTPVILLTVRLSQIRVRGNAHAGGIGGSDRSSLYSDHSRDISEPVRARAFRLVLSA